MKRNRILALLFTVAIASTMVLSGCSKAADQSGGDHPEGDPAHMEGDNTSGEHPK